MSVIVLGHADLPEGANDCGCCEGIAVRTTPVVSNPPGLEAVAYRVGTHARFKQALLARLAAAEYPALADLRTRDDDDFSIALLDAWATVGDVLTFYSERIVNESYLATATERGSILQLARLLGYRPRPGVAAETRLAFTLEAAAVAETTVPAGTRVQSVPGPGEQAQTFETVEELTARPELNALRPRQSRLVKPDSLGDDVAYVRGIAANLKPGDAILLVGPEREADPTNDNWDFRRLTSVEVDVDRDVTRIEWSPGLGSQAPPKNPSGDPSLYVFRVRASLFGYNAPHPMLLPTETRTRYGFGDTSTADWTFTFNGDTVDLDSVYPSVAKDSWVVLSKPTYQEVYRVAAVTEGGRADYAVSGRTTRLTLEGEHLDFFDRGAYRDTAVFAETEPLEFAPTPVTEPVVGDEIVLDGLVEGLEPGRLLIVRGKRARLRVLASALTLVSEADPSQSETVPAGDEVTLLAPPAALPGSSQKQWRLRTNGGFDGSVVAAASAFADAAATGDDPVVAEQVALKRLERADELHSTLVLDPALTLAYDRASAEVLANVAPATHGESTSEVLGSGDGGRPHQRFTLNGRPLTHVGADTPSGTESTLEVRVDDVRWSEVPALYGRGPRERVYVTHTDGEGRTHVTAGDGETGARLPSGSDNVYAAYRTGIGLAGLVGAGSLQTLLSRPLGVSEVTNPLAAEGAEDPESRDHARRNAPVSVLTLDRAVSLRDYEDFSRAFAGIAKALATWSWGGGTRKVFVTVAGPGGATVGEQLRDRLLAALKGAGDPLVPVDVASYRPAHFRVDLRVKVEADRVESVVLEQVEAALTAAFGFEARAFGQPVVLSEVIATVHAVAGVVAVRLGKLYRTSPPNATLERHARLLAALPETAADGTTSAAELLTIHPDPPEIGVMP